MLEVADALATVLSHSRPLEAEVAVLSAATLGQVLAADIAADADSPPFAKSLRDGYAVRSADCASAGAELTVVEEVPAGKVPTKSVGTGETARIFTGAPIPDGADAVVMQEHTEKLGGGRVRIVDAGVKSRQWVYAQGAEMRAGAVVLAKGTPITPAACGVLASVGQTAVPAFPLPRVGVIVTGDEIVEAGTKPRPGQIRNSNGPMLTALTARAGGRPRYLGIARDDRAVTKSLVGEGLDVSDVVVIAGGMSVGDHDFVPEVLKELGVAIRFRQIRMKPGKPILFGTTEKGTLVFGLPGNPVSAFVGFELFVRPALRILGGHAEAGPRTIRLPLADGLAESTDRPTYRPAKLEPHATGWGVRPLTTTGSPDLASMQRADALLVLPAGDTRAAAGTLADVVLL
ncbi:molybdopterin molybdotransferase MoeA [Gemmata sp. JC717]|uniref:molybdopterin molybdotransferase MoeA n=1 Tax=Gemmata algarum TaxID=2975278 RepID=UPI0021BB0B21|nr:gephyrin-like molybdotransferase Glp [Gemmata algarum]MDY3551992.1 molybdopterin molybdotransferase MoeA [Gemmata algarum]